MPGISTVHLGREYRSLSFQMLSLPHGVSRISVCIAVSEARNFYQVCPQQLLWLQIITGLLPSPPQRLELPCFLAGYSPLQTGSAVAPACSEPRLVDLRLCCSFSLPDVMFCTLCNRNAVESSPVILFGDEPVKRLLGGSVLGISLQCHSNKLRIDGRYLQFSHLELMRVCSKHHHMSPLHKASGS